MVYLYGNHACLAALANPDRVIEEVWCTESMAQKIDSLGLAARKGTRRRHVVDKRALDALVDGPHQGVVVKAQPLQTDPIDILHDTDARIVVVLDQVTDPQNVGSILRLCRVFGVGALVTTHAHSPKETGTMAKIASGALEVIPRCVVSNLAEGIRSLKSFGFWCLGLAEGAPQSICEVDLSGKIALIMGSEGAGMRKLTKDLCDFNAYIPSSPEFSTLNVTMATAVSLYEVFCAEGKPTRQK
ncbi:MAG: 23S rRNA (guanosine(2251)-2'-O)-methyltransferase RlmB [Holosporales bacterium]|nr:23S rRNA (guanosine(2251)-2'-O)-methyltransferase RlmB [Holosporales bacterium]